jgi:hypothetical protein
MWKMNLIKSENPNHPIYSPMLKTFMEKDNSSIYFVVLYDKLVFNWAPFRFQTNYYCET